MKYQQNLWFNQDTDDNEIFTVRRTTKDVLEQADALPFWSQDYTQMDKGNFTGSVNSVASRGVQIFREAMNRSVDELASAPPDSYVIGLPTIVEGDGFWGGQQLDKNSLITLDKNTELLFRTSHSSEISVAVITEQRLASYAEQVEQLDIRKLMDNINPVESIPAHINKRMLATLFVGTEHISQMEDGINVHHIWRYFEDNMLNACLQALIHGSENGDRHYDHRVHRHIVTCVRDMTLSNQTEPWTIGELCAVLKISRRTLNHAFKQVLGITPVSYMRNVRLHKIRAELQSYPDRILSIANVASKWGFWHMSLFSRYYRELFGECPSDTLDRARLQ